MKGIRKIVFIKEKKRRGVCLTKMEKVNQRGERESSGEKKEKNAQRWTYLGQHGYMLM